MKEGGVKSTKDALYEIVQEQIELKLISVKFIELMIKEYTQH